MSVASRRLWLACGVAASLLYAAMTAFIPLLWRSYSSFSQTISELSAFDAPTRPVWVWLATLYTLLIIGFGIGVWNAPRASRSLRIAGALFIATGLLGLGWPPMHSRTILAAGGGTLADTLHILWAVLTVTLMFFEIGFGAAGLGRRFIAYSLATCAALLVFGVLTFRAAPALAANAPTPWLGVWERINVLGFMLWQGVLSVALLRRMNDVNLRTT